MTRPLRLGAVRALAKRYRRFPLFSTWSALLVALGYSLPVVLLTSLFGAAVAGFYALGLRIVQTPLRTLGTAVSQVFLAELPAAAREDRLEALVVPALERLASVAVPSALVVMLMGPDLAVVVFGDAWREAGVYIQWITPWLALTVIGAPLAPLFTATERQRAGMVFNAAIVAGRTLALVVAARTGDPVVAIAALGVTSVALQLVMHLWLGRVASVTPGRMLSLLGMAGARPAPFLAPLVVVMLARPFPNDGPIVVGLGAALLVYFAASVLRDRAQRGAT